MLSWIFMNLKLFLSSMKKSKVEIASLILWTFLKRYKTSLEILKKIQMVFKAFQRKTFVLGYFNDLLVFIGFFHRINIRSTSLNLLFLTPRRFLSNYFTFDEFWNKG